MVFCLCPVLCIQCLIFENICSFAGNMISIFIDFCKPSTLLLFYFYADWEIYISSSLCHTFKLFIAASTALASLFLTILNCICLKQASVTLCITYCNIFFLSWSFKKVVTESHVPMPLFDHGFPIFANFPSAISLGSRFLSFITSYN